ncbi:shikimate dehydrogenase [Halohasta litchfieldiae]|jgi:shikimate dehydrogenase|uniref:Shikimate dehydrogenase (NADP(+)) n=1 Tax=Halohasta litchfieldiae TaxID=1073996 RepID=A0A1H6T4U7_9EURY|nr:shikimate dehydrogenase [Halohasta litchfieldiae]ATW87731.1 shikimate dehydrogenase [Halohasta litchfieldiae]SEI75071.1 shikimate dehydrogenase [Halohasta litchfieldiae]
MDVYGLVGNPVGHSVSPPMHEAAYEELGMEASYVAFEPAVDEIRAAIGGADTLGIAGLNVTIPFKQDVAELVDTDDVAERIGAVNTIDFRSEGAPRGYNTDAAGVRRAFEHHDVDLAGEKAVVVGAGGAGRAAAFALSDAAAEIHIANRTVDRAIDLASDVPNASGGSLETLDSQISDATVLVNATSVGMESEETPVPAALLHGDLTVLDAVYAPLETRLLREASEAGATTIDGAWMLLFQGVEAFEQWTDREAPVDVMNRALRDEL